MFIGHRMIEKKDAYTCSAEVVVFVLYVHLRSYSTLVLYRLVRVGFVLCVNVVASGVCCYVWSMPPI